jgi:hypothetical protein
VNDGELRQGSLSLHAFMWIYMRPDTWVVVHSILIDYGKQFHQRSCQALKWAIRKPRGRNP